MRILVVNDDGIRAEGIRVLAEVASMFGHVIVTAPAVQHSARSQAITLRGEMTLAPYEMGLPGVEAWSLTGTPADCVRVAMACLTPRFFKEEEREKFAPCNPEVPAGLPDVVLCGINDGMNCGYDLQYSATVACGLEALSCGVPAVCFSMQKGGSFQAIAPLVKSILEDLRTREIAPNELWNVNFPALPPVLLRGILYDREPARCQIFAGHYEMTDAGDGAKTVVRTETPVLEGLPEASDIAVCRAGYVSIGKVKHFVM